MMVRSFLFLLLFLFCAGMAHAQNPDLQGIRDLLAQQAEDWNKGDIDAFMQVYWKSDSLVFGGASGLTRGWQSTLQRYHRVYPDRSAMGKLTFEILDLREINPGSAMLTGSWVLERETDRPGGHFLLIWKKIEGQWKIIADHTSARCP